MSRTDYKRGLTNYLRAHDVLLACKLFSLAEAEKPWTYSFLATELEISGGEAHNSVDRCRGSGLLLPSREISRENLRDLLSVVVPRVFIASRDGIGRGMPTSIYAAPLAAYFRFSKNALPLVWPVAENHGLEGRRGDSLLPICPSVPVVARRDVVVYELLALADVFRVGSPADRERADELLADRLLGQRPAA